MPSHASIRTLLRGVFLSALVLVAVAVPVSAETEPEYAGRTPPRLSLAEGQVSFFRAGASDWEQAQVNLPLGPGDYLYSGAGSRLEVQIGPRAFLRAASDTQVGVLSQAKGLLRLDLSQGRLAVDLRDLPSGARVEVDTPQGELAAAEPGLYDVTVSADRSSFVARQGGHATVLTRSDSMDLRAGSEIVAGEADGRLSRSQAPPPGDWERWNGERTDRILSATSRGDVSDDIYGVSDLDNYGTWRDEPEYGRVWVPSYVGAGWAPYTDGRWLWDGDYGWTWVDAAPWGWAPYHYGRWVWAGSYWGWAPGPLWAAPVYSPALVAFFGAPGFGVGIGVGVPYVSWVALGWGEPVYPWWGPTWFRGRPCWNGWGGSHQGWHGHDGGHGGGDGGHDRGHGGGPDHFHNQDVPNAVVRVRRDDFARRTTERLSVAADEQRKLRPVHDRLPVEPAEVGVKERPSRGRPPRPGGGVDMARPAPHGPDRGAEPRRAPQYSLDERTGTRQPSPYRRGADEVGAAQPQRPLPSRSRPDAAEVVQRPAHQPQPRPEPPRVTRETVPGSRPVRQEPPVRPLPDRPQRPAPPSNYSAPTYERFDRAPRQQQIPRAEMPMRSAPSVAPPVRPMPGNAPPVHQRSGADYGSRVMQRPSVVMPSQPQHSGGSDSSAGHAPAPSHGGGSGGGGHRSR